MRGYLGSRHRAFRACGSRLLVPVGLWGSAPDLDLLGRHPAVGPVSDGRRRIGAAQFDRRGLKRTFRALCLRQPLDRSTPDRGVRVETTKAKHQIARELRPLLGRTKIPASITTATAIPA